VTDPVVLTYRDPVIGAPPYEVAVAGTYHMLDLAPCRRVIETNGPTCAFLAATIVGIDPMEIPQ
jgi:hypothetical protein